MPRAVFINGYPASGKTTLVKRLREENIQCPIICKDDIKEAFYRELGLNNTDHGTGLNQATLKIIFDMLEDHARADMPILIEANFKPVFDQETVRAIVERYSVQTLQVMLTCSPEELLRRDKERMASGGRASGHTGLSYEGIIKQKNVISHFDLPGSLTMDIDTQLASQKEYNKLIRMICDFVGTKAKVIYL